MTPEFAANVREYAPNVAPEVLNLMEAMERLRDAYVLEGYKPKGQATGSHDSAGNQVRQWFEACMYEL